MKASYDKIADALYFRLKSGKVAKTVKLSDRMLVDIDTKGNTLGIELLNARKQFGQTKTQKFSFSIPAVTA